MTNQTHPAPAVAVIIPSYNSATTLPRAIDSVLAQTCGDFSIYIIDDGSTDNTADLLRTYANRISYVRQPHAGQASARNRGIRESTASYISFLDADDEWLPTKLTQQLAMLQQNPQAGMVYSDCLTSGTGPFSGSHFARAGAPAGGKVFQQFLDNCNVFTPTVMVRRECFTDVGLFNESLPVCEDLNLWLRIAARWQVAVIPEALAIRHHAPASLSRTTSVDLALSSGIVAVEHVRESSPDLRAEDRRALQQAIANRHYEYGSYLLRQGQRALARQQLLQSIHDGRYDWHPPVKLALSLLPHSAFASLRNFRQSLRQSNSTASE